MPLPAPAVIFLLCYLSIPLPMPMLFPFHSFGSRVTGIATYLYTTAWHFISTSLCPTTSLQAQMLPYPLLKGTRCPDHDHITLNCSEENTQ